MWSTFDEFFSRLDTAQERISELEAISVETSKTEKTNRTNSEKKTRNRIYKDCGTTRKCVTHT